MSIDEILHVLRTYPGAQTLAGADLCACPPSEPERGSRRACPKTQPHLVEITGGEPLLQEETYELIDTLISQGYTILVETNGSFPVDNLPEGVIRIIDIKCPGSGMSDKVCWSNLDNLRRNDEIKFVLCDRADYDWAKHVIAKHGLIGKVTSLLSPAMGVTDELSLYSLAKWILADNLSVRLQPQLHKYMGLQ
jgi:7-carboxy-7-deazaguanine synthase